MLRQFGIAAILVMGFVLAGCGNNGSGNINGNWTATLTNPDTTPAFAFTTTFTGANAGALTISSFSFTTSGTCFASGTTTEAGTVSLSGNYNGSVTGSFGMTITDMLPGGVSNALALDGKVAGNTITGTWSLTGGSGCTGNGVFTANKS
jgi:hypothetical protein